MSASWAFLVLSAYGACSLIDDLLRLVFRPSRPSPPNE